MGEGLGMHIEPRLIACEILRFQPTDRFLECIGDEKARRVEHEPSGLRRRQAEVDTSPHGLEESHHRGKRMRVEHGGEGQCFVPGEERRMTGKPSSSARCRSKASGSPV